MSYFTQAELPKINTTSLAKKARKIWLLNCPCHSWVKFLLYKVFEGGDTGIPIALDDHSPVSGAFDEVVDNIVRQVAIGMLKKLLPKEFPLPLIDHHCENQNYCSLGEFIQSL